MQVRLAIHRGTRLRMRLALLIPLMCVEVAPLDAQWPPICRDERLYLHTASASPADSVMEAAATEGATRLIPDLLTIYRRNDPGTVKKDLRAMLHRAQLDDRGGALPGLAYLVVNGDVLLPWDFNDEDLSWLYYTASGDAAPVLYFVERQLRPEARLRALRAIRTVPDSAGQRLVLQYACDAAWLLLAYHSDREFSSLRVIYPAAIDAGFLLPHAMRLLPSQAREGFVTVASLLYPSPHNGLAALMTHTEPGWQWSP